MLNRPMLFIGLLVFFGAVHVLSFGLYGTFAPSEMPTGADVVTFGYDWLSGYLEIVGIIFSIAQGVCVVVFSYEMGSAMLGVFKR